MSTGWTPGWTLYAADSSSIALATAASSAAIAFSSSDTEEEAPAACVSTSASVTVSAGAVVSPVPTVFVGTVAGTVDEGAAPSLSLRCISRRCDLMISGKSDLPFLGNAAEHATAASSRRFMVTASTSESASFRGLNPGVDSVDGAAVDSGMTRVSPSGKVSGTGAPRRVSRRVSPPPSSTPPWCAIHHAFCASVGSCFARVGSCSTAGVSSKITAGVSSSITGAPLLCC